MNNYNDIKYFENMKNLEKPSTLEKVTSSLPVQSAAALIALSSNPLALLLPVLNGSLASGRHKKRVERAIEEINKTLQNHENQLRHITDEQYKIINEAILAVYVTTYPAKIKYLKSAIQNSLIEDIKIQPQESVVLSRVIRDISAEEARFLEKNFHYERIQLSKMSTKHEIKVLNVKPETKEGLTVTGLITLGLLIQAEPTYDESGLMRFSPIVGKLLTLLKAP